MLGALLPIHNPRTDPFPTPSKTAPASKLTTSASTALDNSATQLPKTSSSDVLEYGAWREATHRELNEINEDKSFLQKLCSQSDLRSSVSNDFLKNYNAPNWIAFHIRSGTAAFNDSSMYIIDMNTRNQKALTNV